MSTHNEGPDGWDLALVPFGQSDMPVAEVRLTVRVQTAGGCIWQILQILRAGRPMGTIALIADSRMSSMGSESGGQLGPAWTQAARCIPETRSTRDRAPHNA